MVSELVLVLENDLDALEIYLRAIQLLKGSGEALQHFELLRHDIKVNYSYSTKEQKLKEIQL